MNLDRLPPDVERFFEKKSDQSPKISIEMLRAARQAMGKVIDLNASSQTENNADLDSETQEGLKVLHDLSDRVEAISGSWNMVEIYTPTNIKGEQNKFLDAYSKGEIYNPQFEYEYARNFQLGDARKNLQSILKELTAYHPPKGNRLLRLARIALYSKIKEDLATCDVIEGYQTDNEELVKKGLNVIYAPSNEAIKEEEERRYVEDCKPTTDQKSEKGLLSDEAMKYLKELKLKPEEIKAAFEWALDKYGILRKDEKSEGFVVEISSEVQAIDVRHRSQNGPTIFVPDRARPASEILPLIAHEIEGHARQSMNGQTLFRLGGGGLSQSDEQLYEGLGNISEEKFRKTYFGSGAKKPTRFYATTVEMAEKGLSFHEIFSELIDKSLHTLLKISPENALPQKDQIDKDTWEKAVNQAWRVTYRIMRGHLDTKNELAYAMRKDLAYTAGELAHKALAENGYEHVNEAAIIAPKGLAMLAEFDLHPQNLPYPFKNVAAEYMQMLLDKRKEEKS